MKYLLTTLFLLPVLLLGSCGTAAEIPGAGLWNLSVGDGGRVDIVKGDGIAFRSVGCSFTADGKHTDISEYSRHRLSGTGNFASLA